MYPLCVKLGTISPDGAGWIIFNFELIHSIADVYSYAEDDMVTDPKLADHLAHFGINIHAMEKVF